MVLTSNYRFHALLMLHVTTRCGIQQVGEFACTFGESPVVGKECYLSPLDIPEGCVVQVSGSAAWDMLSEVEDLQVLVFSLRKFQI